MSDLQEAGRDGQNTFTAVGYTGFSPRAYAGKHERNGTHGIGLATKSMS